MNNVSVYKNMEVTYGELEMALLKLNFVKKPKDGFCQMLHQKSGAVVLMPYPLKPKEKVLRIRFAAISDVVADFGVTAHKDDLAKMIEQARQATTQPMA